MRRAAATLLTRLHAGAHWAGVFVASAAPAPSAAAAAACCSSSRSASSAAAGPLIGVCVLERLPVVTPPVPAWQADYAAWQAGVHEGRAKTLPDELLGGPGRGGGGKGGGGGSGEAEAASTSSSSGGAAAWTPAPRTTPADASGDTSTLHRALDKRLFLVLKGGGSSRGGGSAGVRFPAALQGAGEGEPIRAAAERALAAALIPAPGSPPLETYFVGNAPAGHLAAADAPGVAGDDASSSSDSAATLFFHRVQLVAGTPAPASAADGPLAWLTKEELAEAVGAEGPLGTLVRKML